ncbi:hypothetical protein HaLaN_30273 [Haematococcus lacustris]|uniref:Uncharacterized protein n=1 Tax=Haematococcus lacustris TaxID=44745 RepID=A0A6A0AHE5_HAELA|nr:hypothetical protein HaLaN_30273 [Haematococcus lacustris]
MLACQFFQTCDELSDCSSHSSRLSRTQSASAQSPRSISALSFIDRRTYEMDSDLHCGAAQATRHCANADDMSTAQKPASLPQCYGASGHCQLVCWQLKNHGCKQCMTAPRPVLQDLSIEAPGDP